MNTYVRFYAQDGSKTIVELGFRSETEAQRFIDTFKNVGGANNFETDIHQEIGTVSDEIADTRTETGSQRAFQQVMSALYPNAYGQLPKESHAGQ